MLTAPVAVEPVKAAAEPAFKDVHAAGAKSIALLEDAAPKFFPKSGCISCHNVSIPLMAISEARRRGYDVKAASTQQLVKQTLASLGPRREDSLSGYCPLLTSIGTYGAMSLHGEGYTPDSLTDSIARCLAVEQLPDGHWAHGGERPPLSAESDIPSNGALGTDNKAVRSSGTGA